LETQPLNSIHFYFFVMASLSTGGANDAARAELTIGQRVHLERQRQHDEQVAARRALWRPSAELIRAKILPLVLSAPLHERFVEYHQQPDDNPTNDAWCELQSIMRNEDKFAGVTVSHNIHTGLHTICVMLWYPPSYY
jgi:hypothetical protein